MIIMSIKHTDSIFFEFLSIMIPFVIDTVLFISIAVIKSHLKHPQIRLKNNSRVRFEHVLIHMPVYDLIAHLSGCLFRAQLLG